MLLVCEAVHIGHAPHQGSLCENQAAILSVNLFLFQVVLCTLWLY